MTGLHIKKLKIAVIGAGGIATGIHLPLLARRGDVELCAVCDHVDERAASAASRFGFPRTYASYRAMLEREAPDAVYALTEPDALFRIVVDSLKAGAHVFMEKPMGINLIQARTIRDEALAADRVVHVGFNRRFIPLVLETVRQLRSLTKITHVEGRFYKNSSPAFYGGCADAFTCDVIHVIDLVRWIASSNATAAATMETAALPGAETGAWYSLIRFDNGVTGLVRANYHTGGRVHTFEIHGEGASAYIDLGFGGESCRSVILHGGGGQSMAAGSAAGEGEIVLDGKALAGSGHYEDYYGYRDENDCFLLAAAGGSGEASRRRLREDLEAMELLELLKRSRVL